MNRRQSLIWLGGIAALAAGKEMVMAMERSAAKDQFVRLQKPESGATASIEDLLYRRRSTRSFAPGPLTLDEVSRLLFAAQGINRPRGFRTVPSAGALYPLETHLVAGDVNGLEPGVYRYRPDGHELIRASGGDQRQAIAEAALGQAFMAQGAAIAVISADYGRLAWKYRNRSSQYAHIEAGCAAQSLALQAADLGLGATVVGAFDDRRMREILNTAQDMVPLVAMPIGRL